MRHLDKRGIEMKQVAVWMPAELHRLVKADGLNLSRFVTEQLEALYADESAVDALNEKFRLMTAAKASRQKQVDAAVLASENRERLKDTVRAMRDERIAEKAREVDAAVRTEAHVANLGSAWDILVKKKRILTGGLLRKLPENDVNMDFADYWTELARDISKVAGDQFTDQEVINYARHRVAAL